MNIDITPLIARLNAIKSPPELQTIASRAIYCLEIDGDESDVKFAEAVLALVSPRNEREKAEHRRTLELLDAVTTARDRAEAEVTRLREDRNLEKRMRKDAEHAREDLLELNKRLAADLNTALARCAELEHHLSPAPQRSEAAYAVAGEETL